MSHLARGSPVPPRFGSPCAMGPADPPSATGTSTPGAEPVAAHLARGPRGEVALQATSIVCYTRVVCLAHVGTKPGTSWGHLAVGGQPSPHACCGGPTHRTHTDPTPIHSHGGGPCCTQLLTSVGPPALTGGCPPSPDRHGRPAPHTLTAHTLSPLPAVGLSPTTDPSPPTHPCGVPSTDQ